MRCKACLCGRAAERLAELLQQKADDLGIEIQEHRVLPDRVYLSVSAPPTLAPHRIACQLKAHTSRVMRAEFVEMTRIPTLWTRAYLVFGGDHLTPEDVLEVFEAIQPPRRRPGRPRKSDAPVPSYRSEFHDPVRGSR